MSAAIANTASEDAVVVVAAAVVTGEEDESHRSVTMPIADDAVEEPYDGALHTQTINEFLQLADDKKSYDIDLQEVDGDSDRKVYGADLAVKSNESGAKKRKRDDQEGEEDAVDKKRQLQDTYDAALKALKVKCKAEPEGKLYTAFVKLREHGFAFTEKNMEELPDNHFELRSRVLKGMLKISLVNVERHEAWKKRASERHEAAKRAREKEEKERAERIEAQRRAREQAEMEEEKERETTMQNLQSDYTSVAYQRRMADEGNWEDVESCDEAINKFLRVAGVKGAFDIRLREVSDDNGYDKVYGADLVSSNDAPLPKKRQVHYGRWDVDTDDEELYNEDFSDYQQQMIRAKKLQPQQDAYLKALKALKAKCKMEARNKAHLEGEKEEEFMDCIFAARSDKLHTMLQESIQDFDDDQVERAVASWHKERYELDSEGEIEGHEIDWAYKSARRKQQRMAAAGFKKDGAQGAAAESPRVNRKKKRRRCFGTELWSFESHGNLAHRDGDGWGAY